MIRELKTAEEIRAELVRRVAERIRVMGGVDFSSIGYPWHRPEPAEDGCNWYVAWFTKTHRHRAEIAAVVEELKSRWNLC